MVYLFGIVHKNNLNFPLRETQTCRLDLLAYWTQSRGATHVANMASHAISSEFNFGDS
jgi:hypothetical protein